MSNQRASQIVELENTLRSLSKDISGDDAVRKSLQGMLHSYAMSLESPIEMIWRMIMEPHQNASLRTAMQMGVIDDIASSDCPRTATELAAVTKCDKQLIVRIMRPLSAMKIVEEVGCETYTSTPTTKILTIPAMGGGFRFMFDEAAKSVIHMPHFLHKTSYQNPEGPMGCFQDAFNTDLQMFPWLMEHPDQMSNFNDLMVGQKMNRVDWFTFADAKLILLDGYDDGIGGSVLMVDVGGGRGGDLDSFRISHPGVEGKLVLQDLPPVIEDIKDLPGDIVRVKHDFFTPQPVKDARAYYLRYILHDYSDSKCREILKHIVAAMKPDYSKILVFESILPETGTPLFPALLDINMIALLSGMERTKVQWVELLRSVGLEIVKFWVRDGDTEGLIEAVRSGESVE